MAKCFIGVGSNLRKREKNIRLAIEQLQDARVKILMQSRLIETKPVGGPKQGKFLNGVLEIETKLTPSGLLKLCKSIETKLGRVKTVKNGPRIIDLDILLYANKAIRTPKLTIPHPRMLERDFVIVPLKEIAPQVLKRLHLKDK